MGKQYSIRTVPGMIRRNYSLQALNSLRVPSVADEFIEVASVEELADAVDHDQPLFILGAGSNVVLRKHVNGRTIKLAIRQLEIERGDSNEVLVRVGAGESWHELVRATLACGIYGLENLALIPGLVGAAPYQNIGAYGRELSEFVDAVEVFDLETSQHRVLNNQDCCFGYRDSAFKSGDQTHVVVTHVVLKFSRYSPVVDYRDVVDDLQQWPPREINAVAIAEAVCRIRRRKLPDVRQVGNVGSFFKNPVLTRKQFDLLRSKLDVVGYETESEIRVPAARLIEECGWHGYSNGKASVWDRQPLVLINSGSASGSDILDLASQIADDVHRRFDIEFELEPIIVGTD